MKFESWSKNERQHTEHGKLNRIFGKFVIVWCARSRFPIKCELACDGGWPRVTRMRDEEGAEGCQPVSEGSRKRASRRQSTARLRRRSFYISIPLSSPSICLPSICDFSSLVKFSLQSTRGIEYRSLPARTFLRNIPRTSEKGSRDSRVKDAGPSSRKRDREWHLRTRIFDSSWDEIVWWSYDEDDAPISTVAVADADGRWVNFLRVTFAWRTRANICVIARDDRYVF